MKTIIAIGGGELKDLETLSIDRSIVRLVHKKHPRVLFIPTASNDAIGYWETFQSVYGKKLGCETDVLFLIREKVSPKQIKQSILSSDIIYAGGGNTLRMLRIWKKFGVEKLLLKAYERGIILSGLSAGAIAWFRYGSSDARRFSTNGKHADCFIRVTALGFLPLTVSPHHIRERKVRNPGIEKMMQRTPGVALALDDNAALLVRNDRYEILRSKPGVGIEKVFKRNGKIVRKPLRNSGMLDEVFKKS